MNYVDYPSGRIYCFSGSFDSYFNNQTKNKEKLMTQGWLSFLGIGQDSILSYKLLQDQYKSGQSVSSVFHPNFQSPPQFSP